MSGGRLLVLGAGGHGKVAGDCARAAARWSEILFFDDRWPGLSSCGPWDVVGPPVALAEQAQAGDEVFVAIGDGPTRLSWLRILAAGGATAARIVHPAATVSPDTLIGPGTLVVAGAVVNIGAELGVGCIVNTAASVDHDCVLHDGVHLCPGVHLAGGVTVGPETWIGLGSVVRQNLRIGARVTVGAGAVVVADVADDLTVVGVPARPWTAKAEAP